MAKKKTAVEVPLETEINETSTGGETYHATFTPTWRPELDCGDHDSLEAAQQAIVDTAKEFEADVVLGWHRESPVLWLATGHDGQVDTIQTIAKVVQVG